MLNIDVLLARRFCLPGERVLDVGSNFGNTIQNFLECGARSVLSFEPHPESFQSIRTRFRDDHRVVVIPTALGDRDEAAPFYEPSDARGASSINAHFARHRSAARHVSLRQSTVLVRQLDSMAIFPTTFWKIDIEGSELAFLDGATQTLATRPPRAGYVKVFGEPVVPAGHQRAVIDRLKLHFPTVRGIGRRDDGELVLVALDRSNLMPGAPDHAAMRRAGTPLFYFSNESD
jgi:FkbM family methyltransferase